MSFKDTLRRSKLVWEFSYKLALVKAAAFFKNIN
jgi:hypothetical protein